MNNVSDLKICFGIDLRRWLKWASNYSKKLWEGEPRVIMNIVIQHDIFLSVA